MGTLRLGSTIVVPSITKNITNPTLITKNITDNGTYIASNDNADGYSQVVVNVASGGMITVGIPKIVDSNNVLQRSGAMVNFGNATDVGDYALRMAYSESDVVSGLINISNLENISGNHACELMYINCPNITSVDMGNVVNIHGYSGCDQMFRGCTNLASVNISSLEHIGDPTAPYAAYACSSLFQNCPKLSSIDLSNVVIIKGHYACDYMFAGCTSLTSVNLSSLKKIYGDRACICMFSNTKISTLTFNSLEELDISTGKIFDSAFSGCTSLTTVSFPALKIPGRNDNNNGHFYKMLNGCSNVTVHFPSNLQSIMGNWVDVSNGFGGTNTTVLFDFLSKVQEKNLFGRLKFTTSYDIVGRFNDITENLHKSIIKVP